MRVTQVSTWRTRCGIADYTGQLVRALEGTGVECDVAEIDRDVITYCSRDELRDYYDDLANRTAGSDIVHVQHEFAFFSGAYSWRVSLINLRRFLRRLRERRRPTIVTFHSDPFLPYREGLLDQTRRTGALAVWRSMLPGQFAGQRGASVIAHSRTTRRELIDAGIPSGCIDVVRQGVPRSRAIDTTPAERASARALLGLPWDATVLAMFGFVTGYKGHPIAVEALRRLPEHYYLLVVGGRHPWNAQPDLDPVLEGSADPELAGRILYTGFVSPEQRETCMTATDICVAPYTGYPHVSSSAALTWALASGRPVIASDLPTFRELNEDAECVDLVAPQSPSELALAVESLSVDRERQRELTDAARRFGEANSWERVGERHGEIYRRVLGSRPHSAPAGLAGRPARSDAAARPSKPPAPIPVLRRPAFERVPLDDGTRTFWLAHDGDPRDFLIHAVRGLDFASESRWQLVRQLVAGRLAVGDALFVDLGAHLGTFALPLANLGARVLAVDASPRNVSLLRASGIRNRFDRLEVVHAAVGDSSGYVRFCDGPLQGRVVSGDQPGPGDGPLLDVPAVSLDELLLERGVRDVAVVKLDIEGSELAALRGMRALLGGERAPAIVFEVNPDALARRGASVADLIAELAEHGYRTLGIDDFEPGRLVPMSTEDLFGHPVFNAVAIKDGAEIPPSWVVRPFSAMDIGGRITARARSVALGDRVQAGREIALASSEVKHLPAVRDAEAWLGADRRVDVRASVSVVDGGGRHAGNRLRDEAPGGGTRLPFMHGGRPTFALATYADGWGGYGHSADELIVAAATQGADLVWTTIGGIDDGNFSPAARAFEAPGHVRQREVLIIYAGPGDWPSLHAPITLGMTMWETTELPDSWVPSCEATSGLIVPSEFCRRVFAEKVSVPIEVVPLGVNPDAFPELDRPPREPFTFLMVSTLSLRKGPDIALEAFEAEFGPNEPVRMVFKTRHGITDWGARNREPQHPGVQIVDAGLDRRQMLDLYGSADCLVACSRGEASGLTPREAMSTGIPAIVTSWGGMLEIADPDCTFVLDVEGEEAAFGPIYSSKVTGGSSIGRLATPSVEHLRVLMRTAYEDRDRTREMGRRAAAWMRAEWTYEECARKWLAAIATLVDGARRSGNGLRA